MTEEKKDQGHRCEYTHDAFVVKEGGKPAIWHDGTNQCWMTDTQEYDGKHFCILHSPNQDEERKAKKLNNLINNWILSENPNSFRMVGITCGKIEFKNLNFISSLYLTYSDFTDGIYFTNSKFNAELDFSMSNLHQGIWFDNCTCQAYINFFKVHFHDHPVFTGTTFYKNVNFEQSIFFNYAKFGNVKFYGRAWFGNCQFRFFADFKNCTFANEADFGDSVFYGHARFNESVFNKEAIFTAVEFGLDVEFIGVEFKNESIFNLSTFKGYAQFDHTIFTKGPNFIDCNFDLPPSFFDLEFSQTANFQNVKMNDFKTKISESHYNQVQELFNNIKDTKQEAKFFSYVQKAIRNNPETSLIEKIFSWLYELISDYGQNFVRPLIALFIVNAIFILSFIHIRFQNLSNSAYTYEILNLPNNIAPFIKFTKLNIFASSRVWFTNELENVFTKDVLDLNYVIINILASLQTLFSLSLITLFLLALRRNFKMS